MTNGNPAGQRSVTSPIIAAFNQEKDFQMKLPCVYILSSDRHGTLYVGVTSDLIARVWQHKNHVVAGFTSTYCVTQLMWYEVHADMASAIAREHQIKEWRRAWKIDLIEHSNPEWRDLYADIL
jgi:putative endonuclease